MILLTFDMMTYRMHLQLNQKVCIVFTPFLVECVIDFLFL